MTPRSIAPRTNGDRIQPAIDRGRKLLAEAGQWAREHPDELAVTVAPWLLLALATRRHHLTYTEALLISEVGYLCGVAFWAHYRQWKDRPARPSLKEVI